MTATMKLAQAYGFGAEHHVPDDPGPFFYVWTWFLDLHRRRHFDGAAGLSQAIGYGEIVAWQDATATSATPMEIRLLTNIDDIFLKIERREKARKAKVDAAMKSKK